MRLDFETFRMAGPDLSSKTPPYGLCRGDRFAIFTTRQNLGLSEGNLLCGDMSGQHGKTRFSFNNLIAQFLLPNSEFLKTAIKDLEEHRQEQASIGKSNN